MLSYPPSSKKRTLSLTVKSGKSLANMTGEEAIKHTNGEQLETSPAGQLQDKTETSSGKSQPGTQTNSTEAASVGKMPVEQDHKEGEEGEKQSPKQDGPSKKVREGQKWNDRPRKQYSNQKDHPHKRHNNRSNLESQQESSDPVAIRKQVCTSPVLSAFTYSNNNTQGRILLLRLQPPDR